MAIRRYQYERFCSPKGSKRAVAISSAYMLIKFSSFNVLDLPRAPPYHADKMEIEMTETAPFVRPDVALFLQFLNAVPGPRFWEVSADEARAMTDGDFLSRAVRVRAQMNISAKVRAARECVATARSERARCS